MVRRRTWNSEDDGTLRRPNEATCLAALSTLLILIGWDAFSRIRGGDREIEKERGNLWDGEGEKGVAARCCTLVKDLRIEVSSHGGLAWERRARSNESTETINSPARALEEHRDAVTPAKRGCGQQIYLYVRWAHILRVSKTRGAVS